jgi:tripartite-type tricarboxylate transporter receptor subunit TctC
MTKGRSIVGTLGKIGLAVGLLAALTVHEANAQVWPAGQPIQMVVPAGAGGVTDSVARVISQALGDRLKQSFVIDNRPGANGVIGVTLLSKTRPDGYTLMVGTNTTMGANKFLYKSFNLDPVKDFTQLAVVVDVPFALLVPADSPFKSVKDLVAAAKAQPGKLNYGSGTSSALLCAELLKGIAGIDLIRVSYKASPQALIDLMAGRLDLVCEPLASGKVNSNEGRLRTLALTGLTRSSLAPDLPTVIEQGFPGMDYSAWIGFWAPAGLPADIAKRLSDEFMATMKDPEIQKKMIDLGADIRAGGPDVLAAMQRAEIEKIDTVVKKAGITPE